MGPGGGRRPEREDLARRTAAAKALGFKKLEPWMANLRDKDLHNGALVALDYQTGELVAYVGSAELLRDLEQAVVPAAVRRRRQGLPPAGLGVQAVQLRGRHRRQGDHRRHDADGRRHRLRWRLHAGGCRPPRARSGPRPQRAPVLAQHPGRQGDGHQRHRPRLRQGPGIRDAVQGRADRRAGPRPRRPGGPAGRPGHGLRDAGQRRQGHRPHDRS